ncbi:polyadenylation factor I complex subunit Fip1 [Tubulinosema ratisbonensis]|uniref:Polyadenylation factor I complex subunit Fip1 n=1 Tax=Tubulinosema ratisbonensis TaxID=291195 RepID=A0A437ANF4_9MICR|nr:polyadenylation factor I complex subunit Fip1 [Tubulinosema ratisbonensis]
MDDEIKLEDELTETSVEVVLDQPTEDKQLPTLNSNNIYDFEIDNMEDKPWNRPGADITDYFNYGFNETTWKKYIAKQREFVGGKKEEDSYKKNDRDYKDRDYRDYRERDHRERDYRDYKDRDYKERDYKERDHRDKWRGRRR